MPDRSRTTMLATLVRRLGLAALFLACATPGGAGAQQPKQDKPAPPAATQPATRSGAPNPATPPTAQQKAAKAKSPAPATRPAKPASEPVPKFTNDDLPRVGAEADVAPDAGEEAGDEPAGDGADPAAGKPKARAAAGEAGDEDFESVLSEEERAAKTVLLQRQIADAEKRVEQLEGRRRALQNPLHAGLVPASSEEQDAVGGQGNDVRLAWVEEQIAATRGAMQRDREELARIQAP